MAIRRKILSPKKLTRVSLRLFESDVRELKRQAREDSIPWQTRLRAAVHEIIIRKEDKTL